MDTTRREGRSADTPRPGGGARDRLLPLVPHLRAFARTLDADPARADALVRDALVATLGEWRPTASADELPARIEAGMARAAADDGSVRPARA